MDGETSIEPVATPHDEDFDEQAIKMEPEVIILNGDENISYKEDCNRNIDDENICTTKNKRKLVCDCGRRFPTHDWLVAHLATHSCRRSLGTDGEKRPTDEERTHFCSECGKAFYRRKHLQRHEKTHTGGRPHVCEDCGAGFFRSEHLARHVKTHQGQEKYECFVCGRKLTRPEHLTRHLKTHDRDERQVCSHCGEVFVLTKELLDHIQERHL
ncbi:oocyte zinc finger protein XlCOF6.1 [Anabrus simplex]|uniref:oocyte zinc finger protein XlCOF6.1 n=1 Tax=Anabrus simplex TaxID=316456 RepID=UPI0034DD0B19